MMTMKTVVITIEGDGHVEVGIMKMIMMMNIAIIDIDKSIMMKIVTYQRESVMMKLIMIKIIKIIQ